MPDDKEVKSKENRKVRKENLLDRAKISASASAFIVATLIGAMAWFFSNIPSKESIGVQDARSQRIVDWVKELDGKNAEAREQLESRLQSQINTNQAQIMRELDIINGDVKNILVRMRP